ncbi:MAG: SCO family protein [Gemmataceae bacterium]
MSQEIRRRLLLGGLFASALPLAARANSASNNGIVSIRGHLAPLAFTMTLASSGQKVDAAHFHSDVVLLYFGFARCPDTCALTAYNAARLLTRLGKHAARTRFLFVTVDLAHDTVPILRNYLAEFGPPPGIDGLHGTPAELHALAKRYFVYYKAPTSPDSPDPVSSIVHGSAVYLFGRNGTAEDIVSSLGGGDAPIHALTRRVESLLA